MLTCLLIDAQIEMVPEHELIEQIEDEQAGRPLSWACTLLRSLGRQEPLQLIDGMIRGGYLRIVRSDGAEMPAWAWSEVLRSGVIADDVRVVATNAGCRWVRGSE